MTGLLVGLVGLVGSNLCANNLMDERAKKLFLCLI